MLLEEVDALLVEVEAEGVQRVQQLLLLQSAVVVVVIALEEVLGDCVRNKRDATVVQIRRD